MRQAQGNDVMVRFFLTEEERTPATDEVRNPSLPLLSCPAALVCSWFHVLAAQHEGTCYPHICEYHLWNP